MPANLALYTLALALGLSALAAGAVHLPILAAYAALVIASALLCAFSAPAAAAPEARGMRFWFRRGAGQSRPPVLNPEVLAPLIWFALAGYCLLQAVPLPLAWLTRFAPENADVWSRSLRVFGEGPPAFASLSLAPGRSVVEAAKAVSYGVVLLAAAHLGRRHGQAAVLATGFLCALAVALVTAGHQLVGAEHLYGFYEPVSGTFDVAPLLNPNNRAGYLSLGFFCGLAVLFHTRGKPVSLLVAVSLVLLLAEILMCRSRGGTGCLLAGMLVFVVWPRGKRSSLGESPWLAQAAIVVGITLSAVAMAVLAIRQDGWEALFSGSTQKLELFETIGSLLRASSVWGIGRGAFGTFLPSRQDEGANRIYDHAENFVLQWAVEWGVPLSLLALVGLVFCFYPLLSRRVTARSVRRAAVVGAGVLLAQNFVDLGLEVPAVAALFASVLGALTETRTSAAEAPPLAPLLKLGSAALALALGLVLVSGNASPARERATMHAALSAHAGKPTPAFWLELRHAIESFPADPYFPLLGASATLAEGNNALPWITRALERAPASTQAHIVLGRILWARGAKGQALGAFRRALELDPTQSYAVLDLLASWKLGEPELQAVVPEGRTGVLPVELLSQRARELPERMRWLESWAARAPENTEAQYQLALTLLGDAQRGAQLCDGSVPRCLARAGEHLARAGTGSRAKVLEARWLVAQGRARDAEVMLKRACTEVPSDTTCAMALVELTIQNRSPDQDLAIRTLVASACTSPKNCADVHRGLGDRFAGAGEWHAAFDHYQRAIQEEPAPQLYRAAARAAEALDRPAQAAALNERAQALEGSRRP